MPRFYSKAFSLIEVLAVLAIMTFVIAILLRVRSPNPESSKKIILAGLNNIINVAKQEAFSLGKSCRVLFIEKRSKPAMAIVQIQEQDKDNPKNKIYKDIEPLLLSTFLFPDKVNVHAIYINGKENWNENKIRGVELLVIPSGVLPDLALQISILEKNEESRISYILHPFMGTFVEVDGWVRTLAK